MKWDDMFLKDCLSLDWTIPGEKSCYNSVATEIKLLKLTKIAGKWEEVTRIVLTAERLSWPNSVRCAAWMRGERWKQTRLTRVLDDFSPESKKQSLLLSAWCLSMWRKFGILPLFNKVSFVLSLCFHGWTWLLTALTKGINGLTNYPLFRFRWMIAMKHT